MRLLLRDLAPGQEYALQFRTNNGEQVSAWSQIQRVTTTADTTAPSPVTDLLWFAAPKAAGNSINKGSSFIASWTAPTTQASIPPAPLMDLRHYRLTLSNGQKLVEFITTDTNFELTPDMNANAFGQFQNVLTLTVRAVDMTYNESSPVSEIVDPAEPPRPAPGVLSNYFGSVLLEYDLTDVDGDPMPTDVDTIEVHIGTSAGFTTVRSGLNSTLHDRIAVNESAAQQRSLLTNLTHGTQYFAKLIAVSTVGKASEPSDASNGITKTNLTGLQIEDGQIGTDQINFTARQLGGANAYYGEDFPTGGTYREGDIFYNVAIPPVANAGKTYRHNGTDWIEDNTIGVISGLKILTNTLTADAVGTNLLISAKANIADAVIDTAHIDFISAAKITTGILQSSFMVTYGGVQMPAWSFDMNGNASVNNATINGSLTIGHSGNTEALNTAAAAKSYNYVPGESGWIIRGDGTVEFGSAVLRGSFKTANDGRRIEVASGGFTGLIDFYSPNGQRTYIRSVTEENALGLEALQLGIGDPASAWNVGVINLNSSGHHAYRGSVIEYVASNAYRWYVTNTQDDLASTARARMVITKDEFAVWDQTGVRRFWLANDQMEMRIGASSANKWMWWDTLGGFRLYTGTADQYMYLNQGRLTVSTGGTYNAKTHILIPTSTNISARLQLVTPSGYGAIVKSVYTGSDVHLEVRNVNDTGFESVAAAAFTVSSDEAFKDDIAEIPLGESLRRAKNIKPKRFKRKDSVSPKIILPNEDSAADIDDARVEVVASDMEAREEIGFIAQEMPVEVTRRLSDGTLGVDAMQVLAIMYGAFNEHIAEGESWNESNKQEIAELRAAVEARLVRIEEAISQFIREPKKWTNLS